MAGPQQHLLLRGVVASYAMPAIVAESGPHGDQQPITGYRVCGVVGL